MTLACVLFALVEMGLAVPCAIDAGTSPPWAIRTLSKRSWIPIILVVPVFGCTAWLLAGRPRRRLAPRTSRYRGSGLSPAEALRRHPAARAPGLDPGTALTSPGTGPDDDPEFLMELERRIRESRGDW